MNEAKTRPCKKCGIPFSSKHCLACARAYAKQWHQDHPGHAAAYQRRYRKAHPDAGRHYYLNHQEEMKENTTRWRRTHPERAMEHQKKYRAKRRQQKRREKILQAYQQTYGVLPDSEHVE